MHSRFIFFFFQIHASGKWLQGEPTGCATTRCGIGAGASGRPGAVTCSTSSCCCNPNTKPDPKQCPKTADCGKLHRHETNPIILIPQRAQCWVSCQGVFLKHYLNTPTLLGNWKQAEPSGCATKCGVAAGKSGTPGAVSCNTTSCDVSAKPAAKQCPKTVDCGTLNTGMPIS